MDRKYKSPFAPAGVGTAAPSAGRHGALEAGGEDGAGCSEPGSHTVGGVPPRHSAHVADKPTRVVVSLGDPVVWCVAETGRRDGRRVCSAFQMAEDLADDLTPRDDGNDP